MTDFALMFISLDNIQSGWPKTVLVLKMSLNRKSSPGLNELKTWQKKINLFNSYNTG